MNKLGMALSAEWIKLKFTGIFWLSTAGTLFTNLMILALAIYLPGVTDLVPSAVSSEAEEWVSFHYNGILPMLLPMYIVILCALSVLLENRAESWKMLYALPVEKPVVYVSKLLFVIIAFAVSHGIFWGLMLIIPGVAGFGMDFSMVSWSLLIQLYILTVLSSLGITGAMFWISYYSRGFVLPLAVGIMGFVMARLLNDYNIEAFFFPFSYPALAVESLLKNGEFRIDVVIASLTWGTAFTAGGAYQSYRDFRK